jgi:Fe-S cluster assembly protein SufD
LARTDLQTQLLETGAEIVLNGLYIADGRQHIDNHTRVEHIAAHTRSEQDYRGVISDRARAVFNGKAKVHKDAQKTDAQQSNRNLLLSGQAEIDTKPELEIYADDVKCSHGATVGQLDEDALFYLLSRGIDRDTAKGLLIFAFVDDVMARIGIDAVRQRLEQAVIGRLPDADLIRQFTA